MIAHAWRWMAGSTVLLGALALPAKAESPRLLQRQGMEMLAQGDYATAAGQFGAAAEAAADTNLDPAIPRYNAGKALAEAGEFDAAAEAYTQALRTTDLDLQLRAYHNRGNVLARKAETLEQAQDLEGAMSTLREAQSMFAQAITLDPDDNSPKVNYELIEKRLEALQQQKEQQEQQQQQDQEEDQQQDQQDQQQDQQDQSQQDQQQDQQDQSQQDQQQDQQDQQQDQQDQSQQDQQQDQQDQSQQDQQQQDDSSESQDPSGGQPRPSEEMTEQEAKMMLDAIREEEAAERRNVRIQYGQPRQVEKDW